MGRSGWQVAPLMSRRSPEVAAPDIGYTQDNDKLGYSADYLDGKKATNFAIGQFNDQPYNGRSGSIRTIIRQRWSCSPGASGTSCSTTFR